jgi:ParB-like chromosome segregation protein Spo0J
MAKNIVSKIKKAPAPVLPLFGGADDGASFRSPVYNVRPVPLSKIRANAYNPNSVAPPEMKLLELSIMEDGYTMPLVCYYIPDEDVYEIVDGFHRYQILCTNVKILDRERGMAPVVTISGPLSNRMASTIRHNRARGTHSIELMQNIVAELVESGMSDAWIMKHIGMCLDELLRLKQLTGLAALFKDKEFSRSWISDLDNEAKSGVGASVTWQGDGRDMDSLMDDDFAEDEEMSILSMPRTRSAKKAAERKTRKKP